MRIREIPFKIGDVVILKQPESSYSLPAGLADGDKVRIVEQEYRTMIVEKDGRRFTLSALCVVHEYRYEVGNRWLDKNHPLVIAERQRELRRARQRKGTSFAE